MWLQRLGSRQHMYNPQVASLTQVLLQSESFYRWPIVFVPFRDRCTAEQACWNSGDKDEHGENLLNRTSLA